MSNATGLKAGVVCDDVKVFLDIRANEPLNNGMEYTLLLISLLVNILLLILLVWTRRKQETYRRTASRHKEYLEMFIHDMKNPLSVSKSSLELLQDPEMTNMLSVFEQKKYIANALDSINRVFAMVLNALDVSKYGGGGLTLVLEPVDIPLLVEETKREFQIRLQLEKKEILFYPPESFDLAIADRDVLKRVLENIISNSLRHTKEGKGRVEISLTMDKEAGKYDIRIIDNGEGMEETDLEKIFQAFIQLNPERRKEQMDTGIGLTFCKLAVERHGGKILVNSTRNVGTVFTIQMPMDVRDNA